MEGQETVYPISPKGAPASAIQEQRRLESFSWSARFGGQHRPKVMDECLHDWPSRDRGGIPSGRRLAGSLADNDGTHMEKNTRMLGSMTIVADRLTNTFQRRGFREGCNLRLWHTVCNPHMI